MSPVFKYCIHRVDNGEDVSVPIADFERFLKAALDREWSAAPLSRRLREPHRVIFDAADAALAEAFEAARLASLRV